MCVKAWVYKCLSPVFSMVLDTGKESASTLSYNLFGFSVQHILEPVWFLSTA